MIFMIRNFIDSSKCGEEKSHSCKERFQNDRCYLFIRWIAEWMDRRFLDPLIGFFLPALGDLSVLLLNLPYLYFSLFRVKSISLSLAIIYNALLDCLLGLIPFAIGDILDIFYRSYVKNYRLIVGYVEEDLEVIRKVRKNSFFFVVAILILLVAIVYGVKLVIFVFQAFSDVIQGWMA